MSSNFAKQLALTYNECIMFNFLRKLRNRIFYGIASLSVSVLILVLLLLLFQNFDTWIIRGHFMLWAGALTIFVYVYTTRNIDLEHASQTAEEPGANVQRVPPSPIRYVFPILTLVGGAATIFVYVSVFISRYYDRGGEGFIVLLLIYSLPMILIGVVGSAYAFKGVFLVSELSLVVMSLFPLLLIAIFPDPEYLPFYVGPILALIPIMIAIKRAYAHYSSPAVS